MVFCLCGGAPATLDDKVVVKKAPLGNPSAKENDCARGEASEDFLLGTQVMAEHSRAAADSSAFANGEATKVSAVSSAGTPLVGGLDHGTVTNAAPEPSAEAVESSTAAATTVVAVSQHSASAAEHRTATVEPCTSGGFMEEPTAEQTWRNTVPSTVMSHFSDPLKSSSADPLLLDGQSSRGAPPEEGSVSPASDGALAAAEASSGSVPASQEASTAALVPGSIADSSSKSTMTLRYPRASLLSRMFSCNSSATGEADGTEQHQTAQKAQADLAEDFVGGAARALVFLPRSQLQPLRRPEQALEQAAGMLGRPEPEHLLAAIYILRRVTVHHRVLLASYLTDVVALLLDCLELPDPSVCRAVLLELQDLMMSYPSAIPRAMERSFVFVERKLLLLLTLASSSRNPPVAQAAHSVLMHMAMSWPQMRIISLLEPFLDHRQAPIRSEASKVLMAATYRPAL